MVPADGDTALLGATDGQAPTIAAGKTTAELANIQIQSSCNYDLTINGTLISHGSLVQPNTTHGMVGSGTLVLLKTSQATIDDVWVSGYVKTKDVEVLGGARLEVRSTFGQLGPDSTGAGVNSIWEIGGQWGSEPDASGTLYLNGSHFVGFDELHVEKQGYFLCTTGGMLSDVSLQDEGGPEGDQFLIVNLNHFEVAEDQTLTLAGGSYCQTVEDSSSPVSVFAPNSGLSVRNFAGIADGPPAYSIEILGGGLTAYEMASLGAATDILVSDATINFYSPGQFSRNNGPVQTSTLNFRAKDGNTNK
jgi:hypothetical protein